MEPSGQHAAWCFENADPIPPITPDSLAELDMSRIINNPKLRHDVNFDRELHFRPNLDGSKGRLKVQQANQYWKALEAELITYTYVQSRKALEPENLANWDRVMEASLLRLPKVFTAVRDILKTLVPDYDQKAVSERLDVEHMMRQIQNGVCDLIDLANWLAKMLKKHCAPMRDGLVDMMQKELCRGATEGVHARLVNGLRLLMNILEAMKLDVANHQIRHMRPLLIDDALKFQRRYNLHRIEAGRVSALSAKKWLDRQISDLTTEQQSSTPLEALIAGLVRDLLFNDTNSICPSTFYLDLDRLRALRIELHSSIYQVICREVLIEIAGPELRGAELHKATMMLQSSVSDIAGLHGRFVERLDNIAVEIVRVLLTIEGRDPPFDTNLLSLAEQKLRDYLHPNSRVFHAAAKNLSENLIIKIQARVKDCAKLSALDLHDALVPMGSSRTSAVGFGAVCAPPALPALGAETLDPCEDLVRRFTHIIALHWQVWAEMVYLVNTAEPEEDSSSDPGSDSNVDRSGTNSPTIPVAQAVFPPGHKWLPVNVTITEAPSGLPTPAPSPSPENHPSVPGNNESNEDGQSSTTQESQLR